MQLKLTSEKRQPTKLTFKTFFYTTYMKMSYCSHSLCPRMKILTSMLKGNVPSSFLNLYKYLASLNMGHLSHTIKMKRW